MDLQILMAILAPFYWLIWIVRQLTGDKMMPPNG